MFTKLKKIFNKEEAKIEEAKEEIQDDNLGSISYLINKDGEIQVNIQLSELDDESIRIFSKLFARVSTLALSGYTIKLAKKLFTEVGEEEYVKLMLYSAKECETIVEENDLQEQEEYIKPSEMFNEQ